MHPQVCFSMFGVLRLKCHSGCLPVPREWPSPGVMCESSRIGHTHDMAQSRREAAHRAGRLERKHMNLRSVVMQGTFCWRPQPIC